MEAFDILLISLGVALLLIVAAITLLGAFKLGYQFGQFRERLRWHEVGVERRLESDEWPAEVDANKEVN